VATDAFGCTGTESYSITVAPGSTITLSPTSLPAATVGAPYSAVEMTATGGAAPYFYDLSGALPAGMTFVNGTFSGTPTQSGNFPVTVTATDMNGRSGTQSLTLTVNCVAITVGPEIIPSGTNGSPYGPQSYTAMGGTAPYTFSLSAGTLPAGMTFVDGVLSGTPTESGTFLLTVTATDAAGCTGSIPALLQVCCPAASLSASGHSAPAAGGPASVGVVAGSGCAWMALSNDGWITVTSGASGAGNGTVELTVEPNAGAQRTGTISIAELTFTVTQAGASGTDTVGAYVPATGVWFLRNAHSAGPADLSFRFGPAGASLTPVTGDWDGDGDDTVGLYNPATGAFFLKNANSAGAADTTFTYGPAGAGLVPVAGDWDGDGDDTVGLYDPASGTYFLKNANAAGAADLTFRFGRGGAGSLPLAGDWDEDGTDTIGFHDPVTGTYFLKNDNWYGPADLTFRYSTANRVPLAGDWDADGPDAVGAYAPSSGTFFLKNTNAAGPADATFTFGAPGLTPVAGNWDGQ
jgi:hypothetical protein